MTDRSSTAERRERYIFTNDWMMERENDAPFFWVLRDHNGTKVDRDQYRHDLMPRHHLTIDRHIED